MKPRDPMTKALGLLALGAASIHFRWLSLPSLFFCLVALLTTPRQPGNPMLRRTWTMLWLAALSTLAGLTRFVYLDAVPGIVQGGEQAVMQRAVSHLREILRVQDAVRDGAINDADGDGIGSAGLIGELAGTLPPRTGKIEHVPLNKRFQSTVDTPIGPAAVIDGYAFVVCLQSLDGGYSAIPGTRFDEEASEHQFIAYAWPLDASRNSFAIDAEDRIMVRPNSTPGLEPFVGQLHPPPCSSLTSNASHNGWSPWRGKRARANSAATPNPTSPAHDG